MLHDFAISTSFLFDSACLKSQPGLSLSVKPIVLDIGAYASKIKGFILAISQYDWLIRRVK
jgi:hypothetical protein